MSKVTSSELSDTAYDILKVLGKDADFLYDTIESYIKDANNAGKSELWRYGKRSRMIDKNTCIC